MTKEKNEVLLIKGNPFGIQYRHPLEGEYLKHLESLLTERTEGKVWTAKFVDHRITRLEHPEGKEYSTTEDGKWVTYSKNLYVQGDTGLMESVFKEANNESPTVNQA